MKKEVKETLTSLNLLIRTLAGCLSKMTYFFFLEAFLATFFVAFLAAFFVAFFLAAIRSPPFELKFFLTSEECHGFW
ncbi:MAG TPA: hypothetical protein VJ385_02905 [Fibrobacteria bacterium]|nr:hypothetical protein [Fibrobacteria bacterium]